MSDLDWESAMWGYGAGHIMAEMEVEELTKMARVKVESVSIEGDRVVVRIRNVGNTAIMGGFSVSLSKPLPKRERERKLLFGTVTIRRESKTLAEFSTASVLPINGAAEVELKPEKRLEPGPVYTIAAMCENDPETLYAYQFKINEKGRVSPL